MNCHISYKTAKALKAFLGDSAPEPMVWMNRSWLNYQLHDLLSRTFTEVMSKKICPRIEESGFDLEDEWDIAVVLLNNYHEGGLPAVESALWYMMGKPDTEKKGVR